MVDGGLVVEWGVVDDWLVLVVVSVETLVVSQVSWKGVGVVVVVAVSASPEVVVMDVVEAVLLRLWLFGGWLSLGLWKWLWSWLGRCLLSGLWMNWSVMERSGMSSTVGGGVEMSLIVVEIFRVVNWLFAGVVMAFIGVVNWVMSSMSIWVMGIVVILNPFVGMNKFMLVMIVSMVVSIWLEPAVFPVIRPHSMVVTKSWLGVAIISMISLEVVWSCMSVEVWHVMILINYMSISMSVVVSPLIFMSVVAISVAISMSK